MAIVPAKIVKITGKNMTRTYAYRGLEYVLTPVFESTEERLKRGDWRSKIIGYRITQFRIKQGNRTRLKPCDIGVFETIENACDNAEEMIDVLLDE